MAKTKRITMPLSQDITEIWPGFWEFNCRVYDSLSMACSFRADINQAHGIYNYEGAIYSYEEDNNND